MNAIWLLVLAVSMMVAIPIITKWLLKSEPNVWDGEFEIILDDGQVIHASFEKDYVMNGIDIPKGRRIREIITKQVTRGFIPVVITSGIKTTLTSFSKFPEKAQLTNLHFEVTNPEVLPDLVIFMVTSNQKIAHEKEQSDRGLFSPNHINIWYNRPGAKS